MIQFKPVEHHIHDRVQVRLCNRTPAGDADVSSEDIFELRHARRATTLCPDCQEEVHPRDVRSDLYGMGRHSTAHLYSVPVLEGFDAVRNCSHCRRSTDDDCAAWRKLRKAVAVLRQECRRYAKGVDELLVVTGGRPATIYQFAGGSVAYFAPDDLDFQETGELAGDDLAAAQRVLNDRGVPAHKSRVERINRTLDLVVPTSFCVCMRRMSKPAGLDIRKGLTKNLVHLVQSLLGGRYCGIRRSIKVLRTFRPRTWQLLEMLPKAGMLSTSLNSLSHET